MSLHAKIMNLPYLPGFAMCNATEAQLLAHQIGHRDARHAAAELALEADAEIERLRAALETAVRQNEHDMLMTGEELRACRAAMAAKG